MQFLKTLFWVLVAVVLAVFAFNNWTPVEINLWRNLRMDTFLPLLVIGAFVVGVLLVWLPHRASVWSWRRKVATTERKLADEREQRIRAEESVAVRDDRIGGVTSDRLATDRDHVEVVDRPILDADGRVVGHERDVTRS